jgi:hypothetical protein
MEVSSRLHDSAALTQGKKLPVFFGYEARWASEPVWRLWSREKAVTNYFVRAWNVIPFPAYESKVQVIF